MLTTPWNMVEVIKHALSRSQRFGFYEISGRSLCFAVFVFLSLFFQRNLIYIFFCKIRLHGKLLKESCLASGKRCLSNQYLKWKVMRKTKSSLKAFTLPRHCNRAFKQSIMQLSLDTRWQTSFELFHWQESVTAQDGKAHLRSAQRRTEFHLGRWQIADVCFCSLLYAWCKRHSWSSPPGGEIHFKFGLWGTIKTPNGVPKFKLAWNPPTAPAWLVRLLPPLSVVWYNVSDVATQSIKCLHVSFMYREV